MLSSTFPPLHIVRATFTTYVSFQQLSVIQYYSISNTLTEFIYLHYSPLFVFSFPISIPPFDATTCSTQHSFTLDVSLYSSKFSDACWCTKSCTSTTTLPHVRSPLSAEPSSLSPASLVSLCVSEMTSVLSFLLCTPTIPRLPKKV